MYFKISRQSIIQPSEIIRLKYKVQLSSSRNCYCMGRHYFVSGNPVREDRCNCGHYTYGEMQDWGIEFVYERS